MNVIVIRMLLPLDRMIASFFFFFSFCSELDIALLCSAVNFAFSKRRVHVFQSLKFTSLSNVHNLAFNDFCDHTTQRRERKRGSEGWEEKKSDRKEKTERKLILVYWYAVALNTFI